MPPNTPQTSSDYSQLDELYNFENRCYDGPGQAEISVDGEDYNAEVKIIEVDSALRIPTTRRAILKIASDLTTPSDKTWIHTGGFNWGPGQRAGGFTNPLLRTMNESWDSDNPLLVIPGTLGRGTKEWSNSNKISAVKPKDRMKEAKRMASVLATSNIIQGKVGISGHSMGAMEAIAMMIQLIDLGCDVEKMAQLMPCTDEPGVIIDWNFIKRLAGLVPKAVIQSIFGRGSMDFNQQEYSHYMFGVPKDEDVGGKYKMDYDYSVPDSARSFLMWTLNHKRWFEAELNTGIARGVVCGVLQSSQDALLRDPMIENQYDYLAGHDMKMVGNEPFKVDTPHCMPMGLMVQQRGQIETFLRQLFAQQ